MDASHSPQYNPEHVVALLTEVEPQNEQPRSEDFTLEDPTEDRLRVVLDAISNILVSKPQGEVIAVGFQWQQNNIKVQHRGKITITLASNGIIPHETHRHAQELVDDLKKLGESFAKFRRNQNPKIEGKLEQIKREGFAREQSLVFYEGNYPSLQPTMRAFHAKVVAFSCRKIVQRLYKRYRGGSRGQAFVDFARQLPNNQQEEYVLLKQISRVINWMIRNFPKNSNQNPDTKISMLIDGLAHIYNYVQDLQKLPGWELAFLRAFRGNGAAQSFPLQRFLLKMASPAIASMTLLKYAHSPHLYNKYVSRMEVNIRSLPNYSREIHLLKSKEWSELGYRILEDKNIKFKLDKIKEKDIPGSTIQTQYKEQKIQGPVHCECLLALCLIQENQEKVPSLPYIGISKLSCLACWEFFASLRNAGYMFHTKDSHAKAYFPWKYPDTEIDQAIPPRLHEILSRSFFDNLASTYANRFHEQKVRILSDSSADSGDQGRAAPGISIDAFV